MEKLQLLEVAANPIFRHLLQVELKDVEENILRISPGGDTQQFMLDFAVLQQKLHDLKEIQELLSVVIDEQTPERD